MNWNVELKLFLYLSAFSSLCNEYFSQTQSLPKLNTLDLSLVHISVSDHLGNKPIIIIIIIYEEPTKERNSTRYLRTT